MLERWHQMGVPLRSAFPTGNHDSVVRNDRACRRQSHERRVCR